MSFAVSVCTPGVPKSLLVVPGRPMYFGLCTDSGNAVFGLSRQFGNKSAVDNLGLEAQIGVVQGLWYYDSVNKVNVTSISSKCDQLTPATATTLKISEQARINSWRRDNTGLSFEDDYTCCILKWNVPNNYSGDWNWQRGDSDKYGAIVIG